MKIFKTQSKGRDTIQSSTACMTCLARFPLHKEWKPLLTPYDLKLHGHNRTHAQRLYEYLYHPHRFN